MVTSLLQSHLKVSEEVNDLRRGKGVFQKVMRAMDIMKKHKLLFGTSISATQVLNYKTVTSDEFLDMIIAKGVKWAMVLPLHASW